MGKKSGSGLWIRDEPPGSYFLELRNGFWFKIRKYFDADPGSWLRDGRKSDPVFGIDIPSTDFNPKKRFLSNHRYRYDPGFSSQIRILIF
jgi:hypothetical protein